MIPQFPEFKKLELTDKDEVKALINDCHFLPSSDFGFTNLWIWNTANDMQVSKLNGNLAVIFTDYVTNESFVSFIGRNKIAETAETLIRHSEKKYGKTYLKLIPEEMVDELKKEGFMIEADDASHDYIYSVEHMAQMDTWKGSDKSKGIRQFIKHHPEYSVKSLTGKDIPTDELSNLFAQWGKNKNSYSDISDLNEYRAFRRLLEIKDDSIGAILLYVEDKLIGFTVYENSVNHEYAISHFAKADITFHKAVYDILNWEEAKILLAKGIKYYNWEQDLGIEGLRQSKKRYEPVSFIHKFVIGLKKAFESLKTTQNESVNQK